MTDPVKIVGANGERRKNDFYPTPPEVTTALLNFLEERYLIKPGDTIWEPACGNFAMVDVMQARGYPCIGTDLTTGHDYLTTDVTTQYSWIITNPPFYAAEDFIKRSAQKNRPFALLLKAQYWHSARRLKIFREYQPAYVLPLTWRPDFTGQGSSLLDMMWCVWLGQSLITQYIPLKKP